MNNRETIIEVAAALAFMAGLGAFVYIAFCAAYILTPQVY